MAIAIGWNERLAKDAAFLPPRLALGASMLYHGTSKLGGEGRQQTGQMFEGLGLRPGHRLALATGLAETFAGIAAVLGIATRPAALAVLVTQAVAIAKVHRAKGYSVTAGGMEYNLALMAVAAALLLAGPGRLSAHEAVEHAVEGRAPTRLVRRARPSALSRLVRVLR